jgi:hypothetical protein
LGFENFDYTLLEIILASPIYPMKKISAQFILILAFIAGLFPQIAKAQSTTSFDIETTPDNISNIRTIMLPGNSIAVLSWNVGSTNVILKVYDHAGVVRTETDITASFNWPHTYHGSVFINAVSTSEGNIFVSYSAATNSTGIQTYNARYFLMTEQGAVLASGQLNSVDAGSMYSWNIMLERLSDGKILAVWRRMQNENIVFRIFNSNGTPFNNDVAFAGAGTGEAQNSIYTVRAAAGKNGNFMLSLNYWTGNLRGYIFDNNGNPAFSGGGYAFDIDPTLFNSYGNNGLMALANGNFASCWYRNGQTYFIVYDKNGTVVVPQKTTAYLYDPFPVHTPGQEGFYSYEQVRQSADPSIPHTTASMTKYDQEGNVLNTSNFAGGYLIQPSFTFLPGTSGGYVAVYSYYKSYSIMYMPFPMTMVSGDMDTKAMTFDLSLSTLPVQLISFEAKRSTETKILLTWETASELNNHYFEIEKSNDGRSYSSIARVSATGSGSTGDDYSYTDVDNSSNHLFYRLKQYDRDGNWKDLGTRLVRTVKAGKLAAVYPNPVTGNSVTVLAGDQPLPLAYRILDVQGKVITKGNLNQPQQELNVADLKEGIYFLQVGNQVIKIKK